MPPNHPRHFRPFWYLKPMVTTGDFPWPHRWAHRLQGLKGKAEKLRPAKEAKEKELVWLGPKAMVDIYILYIYINIFTIYIYIYVYIYTYIYIYIYYNIYNIYIYIYIHTYIHTNIHTYIHSYITLHYITLHYITLHYTTLHYITG